MPYSFAALRSHLECQYDHPDFQHSAGPSREELTQEVREYFQANRHRPLIIVRSEMLALIMKRARLAVDPQDMFLDHMDVKDVLIQLRYELYHEAEQQLGSAFLEAAYSFRKGVFITQLDTSHTSPDWYNLLKLGPAGIRDKALAAEKDATTQESRDFYRSVAICFDGMCQLLRRFAALAQERGAQELACICEALAIRPPETLHEALQLSLIYDTCQEIEGEPVRSQGLFDRLYFPYYQRDLADGRLTRESAKELLFFFWTKFYAQMHPNGKNICFGGLDAQGNDVCNDLTRLCFEVHYELNRINPKLSLRVHRNMPEDVLLSVMGSLRDGRTAVVFSNDDVAPQMFRNMGKSWEDSYDYTMIGCYEPAVMGREMCCSMSAYGNLVRPLEAVFCNGRTFDGLTIGPECPLPTTYQEFKAEYFRQLTAVLDSALSYTRAFESLWPEINPSPLLSGTMRDCLESGRDVSNHGTRYNSSGVACAGLANVADSLMAVKMLLEEQLCTLPELKEILLANWSGHEQLRQRVLSKIPKWGNGDAQVDAIAKEVMDFVSTKINSTPNGRRGHFQAGLWSIDNNLIFGHDTGATPDGRLANVAIARNMSASVGMEKHGVTALIRSVTTLELAAYPDGAVLDIMVHPSVVSGEDGPRILMGILRTFFAMGGLMAQFNVLNPKELREAQQHPEQHGDLQVRLCGWNSRFVTLSDEEQEAFITQAEGGQL